jgi:demethylmenaquinone methyltransferase/2-methoxy-6-polyprenyl-1,4-benzoquinol methylase
MEEYQYSAKFYDRLLYPFIQSIRIRVIKVVKKYQYKTILDVCCGTGDQLKLLKEHGFDGEGVDISDAMLDIAQNGKVKANCKHQDAAKMHYKDAKFALVMTAFALHEKDHDTARKKLLLFQNYSSISSNGWQEENTTETLDHTSKRVGSPISSPVSPLKK